MPAGRVPAATAVSRRRCDEGSGHSFPDRAIASTLARRGPAVASPCRTAGRRRGAGGSRRPTGGGTVARRPVARRRVLRVRLGGERRRRAWSDGQCWHDHQRRAVAVDLPPGAGCGAGGRRGAAVRGALARALAARRGGRKLAAAAAAALARLVGGAAVARPSVAVAREPERPGDGAGGVLCPAAVAATARRGRPVRCVGRVGGVRAQRPAGAGRGHRRAARLAALAGGGGGGGELRGRQPRARRRLAAGLRCTDGVVVARELRARRPWRGRMAAAVLVVPAAGAARRALAGGLAARQRPGRLVAAAAVAAEGLAVGAAGGGRRGDAGWCR